MNKDLEKIQELSTKLKSLKYKFEIEIESKIKDEFGFEVDCDVICDTNEIYIEDVCNLNTVRFCIDKEHIIYSINTHNKGDLLYDFVYKLTFE
jgi:hypothetical protein